MAAPCSDLNIRGHFIMYNKLCVYISFRSIEQAMQIRTKLQFTVNIKYYV